MEIDIRKFLDAHNDDPKPYKWTKSADQILDSLRRYCENAVLVREERTKRVMEKRAKKTKARNSN